MSDLKSSIANGIRTILDTESGEWKTFSVRIDNGLYSALHVVASVNDLGIGEAIGQSVRLYLKNFVKENESAGTNEQK